MNEIDDREITEIIERVRRRVAAAGDERPGAGLRAKAALTAVDTAELGDGIHATIDEAVAAATQAFRAFGAQGLAGRKGIIDAVRRSMLDHAEILARMAHQETHLGRVEDKVVKN
ncbi:MAG TPA: aldehyde dehydrogenase EutE, partial [Verrucomicrobiae bacterium]|nr:aldehyde dehydrogenase EutE [Verrucomicrobiae bacterium]